MFLIHVHAPTKAQAWKVVHYFWWWCSSIRPYVQNTPTNELATTEDIDWTVKSKFEISEPVSFLSEDNSNKSCSF